MRVVSDNDAPLPAAEIPVEIEDLPLDPTFIDDSDDELDQPEDSLVPPSTDEASS